MEFHVRIAGQPDLGAIESQLFGIDPAALVDHDAASCQLRISTVAHPRELAEAIAAAGYRVTAADIELQPSVCCGGCSG